MSEILTPNDFDVSILSWVEDGAMRQAGKRHDAALRAENARLREAASDMVREWRLHGQCTDSARPMERVLGIHAPFCPIHSGRDCECDLSRAALAPADAGKEG